MKVVIINKSDATGGAAVVTTRLFNALLEAGIEVMMLVAEKRHESPYVELAASASQIKRSFLAERLKIFLANGMNRDTLFKVDTASDGLPLHRNKYVREADVVCLNWVNQGVLSLEEIWGIAKMGKPIVWTMHDMWNMTGICHHAGTCERYTVNCGLCPLLGVKANTTDISFSTWNRKHALYKRCGGRMHFVAVSNWLADLARKSSLLRGAPMSVIYNCFPIPEDELKSEKRHADEKFTITIGAARLDDPVKGFPILVEATRVLSEKYPDIANKCELVTFGNFKNPESAEGIAIPHRHLGTVRGEDAIRRIYAESDAVVSSSLYESFGATLIEGQVYGAIPVSFNRGGQGDIITHKKTGYLAEWDDDVHQAALNLVEGLIWAREISIDEKQSAQIRKEMFESARERFDGRQIAAQYIRLFNSMI